ncbi:lon protease 2, peroxisomal [Clarias magur]|uniref:Lon protease 2, peroxisomal n=1 Tax=Clarias magur TaxID=1594786 RepID=A0A8J4XBY8_CLAMG|nr:lon protease 2, peroxisomal [Clarias magur]
MPGGLCHVSYPHHAAPFSTAALVPRCAAANPSFMGWLPGLSLRALKGDKRVNPVELIVMDCS